MKFGSNSIKMKKTIQILLFLSVSICFSQGTINTMFYNLFRFPSSNPANRELILKNVLDTYNPDLLMVCELETNAGADLILNQALLPSNPNFAKATFYTNTSSTTDYIQQLVFFNTQKLTLQSQEILQTGLRDINHYIFKLNTVEASTNPLFVDVFVAHLKSSTGTDNQQYRLDMVNVFTTALNSIPSSHYVLFAGDFNFYTATEPGYQEILDPTNAIVMKDPINSPGSWNNSTFTPIHTQCTRISNAGFGTGVNAGGSGGMDDRFDFIMMSENFFNTGNLSYVANSYKAYGNNANCFNNDINSTICTGTYSQSLRENLYWMSDHIPVVMQMQTNQTFLETPEFYRTQTFYLENTLVTDFLNVKNNQTKKATYQIYNSLGQLINEGSIQQNTQTINVVTFAKGLYFLTINNNYTFKFIKQ